MVTIYPKYEKRDKPNWRESEIIDGKSYEEWKKGKKKAGQIAGQQQQPQKPVTLIDSIKKQIADHQGNWSVDDLKAVGDLVNQRIEEKLQTDFPSNEELINELQAQYDKITKQIFDIRKEIRDLDFAGKFKEADTAEEKINKLNDERYSLLTKITGLRAKGRNRNVDAVRAVLSEIRTIGGITEKDFKQFLSVSKKSKTSEEFVAAMNYYPRSWLIASKDADRKLMPKWTSGRAYYRHYGLKGGSDILTSGSRSTTIHELGHRFERVVKGIKDSETEFYKRRTAGDQLKWLGPGYARDELTRFDNFLNPYMGKDYGGSAYELVSMGFQYAFTDYERLKKDKDMCDWIFGILAAL